MMHTSQSFFQGQGRARCSCLPGAFVAEVATLDGGTMEALCPGVSEEQLHRPESLSERLGVKRGLRNPDGTGVLAGLTNVCDVVGYKKDQDGKDYPDAGQADLPRRQYQ